MPGEKPVTMPDDEQALHLLDRARAAQKLAYAPYSHYAVGAALLTADGKVFTGTNIENASYSLAMCAERVALYKAVSEGHRRLAAIAVIGPGGRVSPPCGSCRQALAEFAPELQVILPSVEPGKDFECFVLADLLPRAFGPEELLHSGHEAGEESL